MGVGLSPLVGAGALQALQVAAGAYFTVRLLGPVG